MHYLLIYDYAGDYLACRDAYRADHLRRAWDAEARGELVLAGALADPADGAVFVFSTESPEPATRFAEDDPYVRHGLVTRWRVRPWTTVVGRDATTPLRPEP